LLASLADDDLEEYLDQVTLEKLTGNTVTSKTMLRGLIEKAGEKGWCVVDQELEIGLRSISVPIHDKNGSVIAALNVACPSSRITPQDMHGKILRELQTASRDITASLQY
jgi:IclR family pca regulon transcriptional regulator